MITLSFVLTSIIILLSPGPTNTVLAACGASLGLRRAAIMPLAEAMGYIVAVSVFATVADSLRGSAVAFATIKLTAAGWLLYSAFKLWGMSFHTDARPAREAFIRIFLTTLVNPKAILVGTVLIPVEAVHFAIWVLTYALLSTVAGLGWVAFGASLPFSVRRHTYKLASLVLGGFSLAAVASALSI
ncbi:LysE family translocator [Rhizobium paranaense]|uniref:Threonine/homoserine/homoserine lactone efflux protein n=1 Tax=Rhizobium paranaense TaxID=1650438 RepID=A0A7W8XYH2_9HYPH|nr:threonine transporter [Rhizobium paranaense]MBB5577689.1 threonine/homoserine/homoserine lactone efflux protein [Rhizobium paranaense]